MGAFSELFWNSSHMPGGQPRTMKTLALQFRHLQELRQGRFLVGAPLCGCRGSGRAVVCRGNPEWLPVAPEGGSS